jgi:major membrane immunogen (membrane-anchored lipoprotein)
MRKVLIVLIAVCLAAPFALAEYKDGLHSAKDKADKRGYAGEIKLTVEKGQITKAVFDEVKGPKNSKRNDASYNKMMKAGKSKVSWTEAADKFQQSLVKTQDPAKVDKVSGATDSYKRFVGLAKIALGAK